MEDFQTLLQRFRRSPDWYEHYQKLVQKILADPDIHNFIQQHQQELTTDGIQRSTKDLYEYWLYHQQQGFVPGYQPFLRVHQHGIEVVYSTTPQQQQQQQRLKTQRLKQSISLPHNLAQADLTDYNVSDERQAAFNAALDLTTALISTTGSTPATLVKGLYLSGPFGVGKTYLLAAIANELAKHSIQSLLLHFPTFSFDLKQAMQNQNLGSRISQAQLVPVLIVDDLGAESLSPWVRDEILGVILQARMQENRTTLFSSNFSMAELQQYLQSTAKGQEPIKAQRIMERIRYLATEYQVGGPNRRN